MNLLNILKKKLSYVSLVLAICFALFIRLSYFSNNSQNGYNATNWDALGYYIYLPGTFIYEDVKEVNWLPAIDSTYNVTGGDFYQANQLPDGNYVFKYLGGVAIMELPFFTIGHITALLSGEKADGFSWPYQYAIMWGALFWFMLGLFILRKVLLKYYSESVTAITIIMIAFASNLIQYVSVDSAMSHSYIFPLYCLLLWWTIKWHDTFKWKYALGIGFVIGLATISRPTELIMIFIPLLWSLNNDSSWKSKWRKIKSLYPQVLICLFGGFIGILPQLIYWKHSTGSWIYDVGSKWYFLNPWWRVLVGFEKGWFIYTPIAIFMVLGLFFIKGKPFKRAITTFIILNIWIIISWSDWKYGASYSTRALSHSYPVFALVLAGFVDYFYHGYKRYIVLVVGAYLCVVNVVQIRQYNTSIFPYNDMNARYYASVYLDLNPSPLDYSLLDTDEIMPREYSKKPTKKTKRAQHENLNIDKGQSFSIAEINLKGEHWLTSKSKLLSSYGIKNSKFIYTAFRNNSIIKTKYFRSDIPFAKDGEMISYENHFKIPEGSDSVVITIESTDKLDIKWLEVETALY